MGNGTAPRSKAFLDPQRSQPHEVPQQTSNCWPNTNVSSPRSVTSHSASVIFSHTVLCPRQAYAPRTADRACAQVEPPERPPFATIARDNHQMHSHFDSDFDTPPADSADDPHHPSYHTCHASCASSAICHTSTTRIPRQCCARCKASPLTTEARAAQGEPLGAGAPVVRFTRRARLHLRQKGNRSAEPALGDSAGTELPEIPSWCEQPGGLA